MAKFRNLKNNWQRISLRNRIMVITACVLAVLVFIRFFDVSSLAQLPMVSTVDKEQKELSRLVKRIKVEQKEQKQAREKINRLRNNLGRYVWRMQDRNAPSVIQAKLQDVASRNNVTIQNISSPRTNDVTEHIRSAQVSIRISSNMREITRFLAALEKNKQPFYWDNCHIRPESPGKSNRVMLSGRIKIMYLTPEAEDLIFVEGGV